MALVKRFLNSRLSGWVIVVAALAAWEWSSATKWIDTPSWPLVSEVFAAWYRLAVSGVLFVHLGNSGWRMAVGYILAIGVGVLLGILMGYYPVVRNLLETTVEMIRPIPSPAYIPIALLFLGIGHEMKIFMIFLASLFPILINTMAGVVGVDETRIQTGRTFGLSNRQILFSIILPSSAPYILSGMRISLAVALVLVVISEIVAANSGIGYFIVYMQRAFRVTDMYAGIFTLAAVGYLLNVGFQALERRLLFWHVSRQDVR